MDPPVVRYSVSYKGHIHQTQLLSICSEDQYFTALLVKLFEYVGFEVLTAVNMKIAVFWVVAPCSLGDRPDDGGSKDL
jgi:hypothetical protein